MKQMIFNGGEPLPGCPNNWDEARKWETSANEGKDDHREPRWGFDCGFKLDFDGPLVDVSSRFYPPKTYYGEKWDGTITVLVLGEKVIEHEIEADSLDDLKKAAEKFITDIAQRFSA